jgi:hypothetical protein
MKYEEEIFEKMLCAMYLLPYQFTMADDIIHLTSITEYYPALPIVSRTLTDALLKSPCINCFFMRRKVNQLLESAVKLRHEYLFRDCLAWTVIPWAEPHYLRLSEQSVFKFKKAADNIHQDITTKVAEAHRMIISKIGEDSDGSPSTEEKFATVMSAARNSCMGEPATNFRTLERRRFACLSIFTRFIPRESFRAPVFRSKWY